MNKTRFYTYDIFNIKDEVVKWEYFDFCYKEALKCGLKCKCIIEDPFMKLELWGSKHEFLKYYLKTLTKCKCKLDGVKRFISFLFES